MKIDRIFALTGISALFFSAFAFKPKTDVPLRYMKVTDVERTDSTLRLGVRLQHQPHFWVNVPATTRLIDTADSTRQFKITGAENLTLDEKVWMPETGWHEGILIFERVPADVKVVDMVESDIHDVRNAILGIHLDEEDTNVAPRLVTAADIMALNRTDSVAWTGLDPKRYTDLHFYDKDGKAVLKGKVMDYSPRCGVATFSIRTRDDFTGLEKVNVGDINPDGSFEIEVPVSYPQFDYFQLGHINKNLFMIPGDTLSVVTTMSFSSDQHGYKPEYFGYEGTPDDGIAVNLLADSLINLENLYGKYAVAESDAMKSETYRSNERLGALLDSVVTGLPMLLRDVPVSGYAKDLLSAIAIAEICEMMEDLELNFRSSKGPRYVPDNDGKYTYQEGESLDIAEFVAPRMKHKELTYDNPLLVCNGFVLPNRWNFNSLFRKSYLAAIGFSESADTNGEYISAEDPAEPFANEKSYLDSIGIGNCFAAQFVRSHSFLEGIKTHETPSYQNLERQNRILCQLIKHNGIDVLNDIIMSEYTGFVKDVLIAENEFGAVGDASIVIEGTPGGDVLEKIIAPYRGNVLFLDFWGIGCGPCRAGMQRQKPWLEQLADQPFRALYIANADENKEACERWLRNEEIKGEHIFVTGDDWMRLCALFTITGIPHGVLIGKDSKVIAPDYNFYPEEIKFQAALRK